MTLRLLYDEHVLEALGAGAADEEIWRYAVDHDRIVFTNDRDYVDGTADPGDGTHPGVILYSGDAWNHIADAVVSIDRSMPAEGIIAGDLELFVPGGWV